MHHRVAHARDCGFAHIERHAMIKNSSDAAHLEKASPRRFCKKTTVSANGVGTHELCKKSGDTLTMRGEITPSIKSYLFQRIMADRSGNFVSLMRGNHPRYQC